MFEPESKCYYYALSYLNRYPKTEKELTVKLMEKGYSSFDIEKTMEFLKYKKFVDDRQFAEMYIQSEIVRKGKPKIAVQNKLYQKGVDKYLIQEVMEEMEEEMDGGMGNKIQKEIDKMKNKGMEGFDIIQKLMGKGYKLDQIKEVVAKGDDD